MNLITSAGIDVSPYHYQRNHSIRFSYGYDPKKSSYHLTWALRSFGIKTTCSNQTDNFLQLLSVFGFTYKVSLSENNERVVPSLKIFLKIILR